MASAAGQPLGESQLKGPEAAVQRETFSWPQMRTQCSLHCLPRGTGPGTPQARLDPNRQPCEVIHLHGFGCLRQSQKTTPATSQIYYANTATYPALLGRSSTCKTATRQGRSVYRPFKRIPPQTKTRSKKATRSLRQSELGGGERSRGNLLHFYAKPEPELV